MAGIKYENVNFNSILRGGIHFPKTKNGSVLYTRIQSFNGKDDDGDFYDKKLETDPIYMEQSKIVYNSPTNIKRIFITGDKIYVRYHRTPVDKKNKAMKSYHLSHISTFNNNKNLFEVAKDLIDADRKKAQFEAERQVNPKAELTLYNVNGNAGNTNNLLKALSTGWVASNVEELYFDWTALLPYEVYSIIMPDMGTPANIAKYFLNPQNQPKMIKNDLVKNAIYKFNSGGVKDLSKRFPRLRIAAMISNLDSILEEVWDNQDKEMYGTDYDKNIQTWFSTHRDLITQKGGSVIYSTFSGQLTEYKTKEQQYLFDAEKLKDFFETNIEKFKSSKRSKAYGATGNGKSQEEKEKEELNMEMGPVEEMMVSMEQELGKDSEQFKKFLKMTSDSYSKKQMIALLDVFTKPNRDRYKKILGL